MAMILGTILTIAWLSLHACNAFFFSTHSIIIRPSSTAPTILQYTTTNNHNRQRTSSLSSTFSSSQSANDNVGNKSFHYDQEPRGTSYISQISQRDLWERRQLRRPKRGNERLVNTMRRDAPNRYVCNCNILWNVPIFLLLCYSYIYEAFSLSWGLFLLLLCK